jgi:hypothetical protein
MSDLITIPERESQALSKYLIGQPCPPQITERYAEAVNKLYAALTAGEQKTWDKMMAYGFYLKLIDSGLAIVNPQSALRKRIFIMLTLLEATPDFTAYFLPQQRSIFYLVVLGCRMSFSALYMICGVITVKLLSIG